MASLDALFAAELNKAKDLIRKKHPQNHQIDQLPIALQHFVQQSGLADMGNAREVKIEWATTKLKLSTKGKWKKMSCMQYNFLPVPIRLVHMKTKPFGLFALEALDTFRNGHGQMMVKVARLFTLLNAKSPELDQAELVTILAETMIIAAYALQTYIHWEEINTYQVRGTIAYQGVKASGIFHFNSNFEITKFETNDRYATDKKGKFSQTKWTAECHTYVKHGPFKFPTMFRCTWSNADSDFVYFEGYIKNIMVHALKTPTR